MHYFATSPQRGGRSPVVRTPWKQRVADAVPRKLLRRICLREVEGDFQSPSLVRHVHRHLDVFERVTRLEEVSDIEGARRDQRDRFVERGEPLFELRIAGHHDRAPARECSRPAPP